MARSGKIEIDKDAGQPLGLVLPHPEPDQCGNNCIFCFVHQLPPGMRRSLYVKDEDYRFSYLYGAYVTLTNLDEAALQRILTRQLVAALRLGACHRSAVAGTPARPPRPADSRPSPATGRRPASSCTPRW